MLIVLTIPGMWSSRTALISALANSGLCCDGYAIGEPNFSGICEIEMRGHEERMERAFRAGACGRMSEQDFSRITLHKTVVYLIAEGGTVEKAAEMLKLACKFLDVGGLGVKVDSSGAAHPAVLWKGYHGRAIKGLLDAFIIYLFSETFLYSCGMHNLGFRDLIVNERRDQVSEQILSDFCGMVLTSKRPIKHGDIFRHCETGRQYVVADSNPEYFAADSLFHNPFGYWDLRTKTGGQATGSTLDT